MFTGFPEETIKYFLDLRFNNHASYYRETKERFESHVQAPFFAFINELASAMLSIDPQMEVRPHKCLARIHRDTRFSKDKSPYRDHLWLLFRRGLEKRDQCVMYWFELSPENVGWGLGFWGENRPAMNMLRRRMAAKPDAFLRLIGACDLEKNCFQLSGVDFKRMVIPESIPPPLEPWYKKKQLYLEKQGLSLKDAFADELASRVARDFTSLAPMYQTLRGCLDELCLTE